MLKWFLILSVSLFSFDQTKEKIVQSLSQTLQGSSQSMPVMILLGGYVGSGKTTLSTALQKKYGLTVFSLNSIRQAMLDEGIDIRSNKQEERKILFELYPRLLAPVIANSQHLVIDANANRQGIEDAVRFLREHGAEHYQIVKIHLTASEEELYRRVRARIHQERLHQGTETDLTYELRTPSKAIYPQDYDLIVDTEKTSLEDELRTVSTILDHLLN